MCGAKLHDVEVGGGEEEDGGAARVDVENVLSC